MPRSKWLLTGWLVLAVFASSSLVLAESQQPEVRVDTAGQFTGRGMIVTGFSSPTIQARVWGMVWQIDTSRLQTYTIQSGQSISLSDVYLNLAVGDEIEVYGSMDQNRGVVNATTIYNRTRSSYNYNYGSNYNYGTNYNNYSYNYSDCTNYNGYRMTFNDARNIALNTSACTIVGSVSQNAYCNSNTGTWWLDLSQSSYSGCNPACVIDVQNRSASVNWRCTGLATPSYLNSTDQSADTNYQMNLLTQIRDILKNFVDKIR